MASRLRFVSLSGREFRDQLVAPKDGLLSNLLSNRETYHVVAPLTDSEMVVPPAGIEPAHMV